MPKEVRLTLRNDVQELGRLRDAIIELLDANGVPLPTSLAMQLALEEAVVNIMDHGYSDQDRHSIRVRIAVEPGAILARVEDDGKEFNPLAAPEPERAASLEDTNEGGLGIPLLREMADRIEYCRAGNRNRLDFRIDRKA